MTGADRLAELLHTHGAATIHIALHHTASGGKATTHVDLSDAERRIIAMMDAALPTDRAEAILREHYESVTRENRDDNVRYVTFDVCGFHTDTGRS